MAELKDVTVRKAAPKAARYEIRCGVRSGLRLVVQPSGAKSFVYRYTFGRSYKKLTLGSYPAMTLATAIAEHRKAADALASGVEPAIAFKAKRGRSVDADATVTAYAKLYETLHLPTLSTGTANYYKAELGRITDKLGNKDIKTVTQEDVQNVIDAAMTRGTAARNTTYKVAKAFFGFAAPRAGIESPAAKIERPSKDNEGDRVLDDDEIKIVWKAADAAGGSPGALVKMLILSGARRTEMTHLERIEVKAKAIELPGERTKNGEPHTIPLTWSMRRVLDACPKGGKFALTGADQGLGGHTKAKAAIKTPTLRPWTFHDLRRSFSTGLAKLGVPINVTERMLNHKVGEGKTPLQRIYNKHEYTTEIATAFELWTNHIAALVGEKPADEKAAA